MPKKKFLFIVFEGIEGSGKSYQSKKLYNSIKQRKLSSILTREPGGTIGAERIRELILKDYFHKDKREKFHKYTDTLLYLAARNEHVRNKIKPELLKKKVVICDRFVDSTIAYQVYGKGVKKNFIDTIQKYILGKIKPDLTILLTVSHKKAEKRLNKRKSKNRYDKFSRVFYQKAQNAFVKIAKTNKKKYFIIDNSNDDINIEKEIERIVFKKIKY